MRVLSMFDWVKKNINKLIVIGSNLKGFVSYGVLSFATLVLALDFVKKIFVGFSTTRRFSSTLSTYRCLFDVDVRVYLFQHSSHDLFYVDLLISLRGSSISP